MGQDIVPLPYLDDTPRYAARSVGQQVFVLLILLLLLSSLLSSYRWYCFHEQPSLEVDGLLKQPRPLVAVTVDPAGGDVAA